MGARWPWTAWCANGHKSSGFSGGSDGVCQIQLANGVYCEAPVVKEQQDPWPDESFGMEVKTQEDPVAPNKYDAILQQQIEELRQTLIEAIEEVSLHQVDPDYCTSKQMLQRWKKLVGTA